MSYTTAIDACASVGDPIGAMELLREMKERGVQPNHRSFNAVMSAYGKVGYAHQAVSVLQVSRWMRQEYIMYSIAFPSFPVDTDWYVLCHGFSSS